MDTFLVLNMRRLVLLIFIMFEGEITLFTYADTEFNTLMVYLSLFVVYLFLLTHISCFSTYLHCLEGVVFLRVMARHNKDKLCSIASI